VALLLLLVALALLLVRERGRQTTVAGSMEEELVLAARALMLALGALTVEPRLELAPTELEASALDGASARTMFFAKSVNATEIALMTSVETPGILS